jgi:NitT/TauT family transport system permease protein
MTTSTGPTTAEAPRRIVRALRLDRQRVRRTVISIVAVMVAWEIGARLIGNPILVVPLTEVWDAFVGLLESGELAKHTWVSAEELAIGFGLAALAGIILGVLTALNSLVRDLTDPWLTALYSTPTVALTPLLIIIFGIDIWSKVAIVFLVAIFPIWINTSAGIQSADRHLVEVARSFAASPMQILVKVLLPAALPFIVAGLRLGIGRGIVGVVVGELFAARAGLGFLIVTSSQIFATAELYVGIIILALTGVVSVEALRWVERRLTPWRQEGV